MEIKNILKKPYTSKQKSDFIVENNHRLGYVIKEMPTEIQAWGRTRQEQADFEIENQKAYIKQVRDKMIDGMTWRVERANEQRELGLEPVDDMQKLLEYRQYLRDYPDTVEKWWEHEPMTYEKWLSK